MRYLAIILTLLILLSCKKENIVKGELSYLVGDYEWIYSYHYISGYTTNQELTDKYGIRITSNGKMYVFKNGVEIKKYHLERNDSKTYTDDEFIVYKNRKEGDLLYYSGDTIWTVELPIDRGNNYYLKK